MAPLDTYPPLPFLVEKSYMPSGLDVTVHLIMMYFIAIIYRAPERMYTWILGSY